MTGLLAASGARATDQADALSLDSLIEDQDALCDILPLSLDELMDQNVSSLARKQQVVKNTAAAAFVISAEDIRRSGATNIADVLRMAPGMDVARINSWNWSVSARGFNDLYANKLQVMIDGRSIYDPQTGGVYWGQQNQFLKNIKRIEVIRGPSGTLWGPNAVNAVINIITSDAKETQGGLINGGGGNKEQSGGVRYGVKLDQNTYARVSGNGVYRDASPSLPSNPIGNTADFGNAETTNFRIDSELNSHDKLMLEGEVDDYRLMGYFIGSTSNTGAAANPNWNWQQNNFGRDGDNYSLQGHWEHENDTGHNWKLNMSLTHTNWSLAVDQMNRTYYVLDFHDRFPTMGRHNLMWGVYYQTISDNFVNSYALAFRPDSFTQNNSGVFLQDEIDLSGTMQLTLANRVTNFTYTGWETEPNIRLLWNANKQHNFWGSVSRSVVAPNRAQHSINLFTPIPGQNVFVLTQGNPNMKTENLLAFELGWRWRMLCDLDLDSAFFYNIYDRMQGTYITGYADIQPYGEVLHASVVNNRQVTSYGAELAMNYHVNHNWRLQASYSYIGFSTRYDPKLNWYRDPLAELHYDPQQQLSLRSLFDVGNDVELDLWGRYVDQIYKDYIPIPAYFGLDARLGWHPLKNLEISIAGQNLLYEQHTEFADLLYIPMLSQIQRSYFAQFSWRF